MWSRVVRFLAIAVFVASFSPDARAQLIGQFAPVGAETRVNAYTAGDQQSHRVVALTGGGYVVVWLSPGQDGSGYGVYAQRYAADNSPVGGEVQVNTYTANNQYPTHVVALNDGGYVVVWESFGQDGSGYGVYAQRYAADNSPVGGEMRVNTYTSGDQQPTHTVALNDGGYVVVWSSEGQDGSGTGVYLQRYAADNSPVGGEARANTFTSGSQFPMHALALSDGGYVLVWRSDSQDSSSVGVYAQRYAADNSPVGGEVQVNTYVNSQQWPTHAIAFNDGGYVIVWYSLGQDGSGTGVYAQRYAADNSPVGGETQVNTFTAGDQYPTHAVALNDGGYVVVWYSFGQDGSSYGVYAQRYAADNSPVGGEVQINTYTMDAQIPTHAIALNDGGYVVVWQSSNQDGSSTGVYAQRYAANNSPVGGEVQVNTYTTDSQSPESLIALPDGGYLVTWLSRFQDSFDYFGSSYGVYGQRFAADGSKSSGEFRVNAYAPGDQTGSAPVLLADASLVIVWNSYLQDGNGWGVYAQRYRTTGAPVAVADVARTVAGVPVTISPLANDIDPDVGDTLTITSAVSRYGNATVNPNGTITYVSNSPCTTRDTITYTVQDSTLLSATGRVAVRQTLGPIMSLAPSGNLELIGPPGGPFVPSHAMTIANQGCAFLGWEAWSTAPWISIGGGNRWTDAFGTSTLAIGASTAANSLAAGGYGTWLNIANTTNGVGTSRVRVILRVREGWATDGFANAVLISGDNGSVASNNDAAGADPGEPDHAGVSQPGMKSVWWKWTAPADGRYAFRTGLSNFDTTLAVYTGTSVDALTQIAANDDYAPIAPKSRVAFDAVSGTTYYIAVAGKAGASGNIRLIWNPLPGS